jgi:N-methylhydantoinase B/acetone carboxylase alpha subunit
MAIIDATSELHSASAGIGWDGRRLDEMLAESERLFADTGHYVARAPMMSSDPIGYEKLFFLIRGGLSARETALNTLAADRASAGRLALYTPEGTACLSTGIIVHVHTMST